MGPLKSYDVVVDGLPTTLKLNDADAQRRGLLPPEPDATAAAKVAKPAANKARTPPAK